MDTMKGLKRTHYCGILSNIFVAEMFDGMDI